MISRVAESCYWLNRYVERVETLARLLSVNLTFQLDADLPEVERWWPLVIVHGEQEVYRQNGGGDPTDDGAAVQNYLVWNEKSTSSMLSSLRMARENARTIRETISLEMWEVLNDLWVWMIDPTSLQSFERDPHSFYIHVRNACLLFHGAANATMLHEDPFEFMRLGTAIERAGQTARILDVKYHSIGPTDPRIETPVETAQWIATLRFCSAAEPFFKREDNFLAGREIAAFLLFEPAFPRSVLHNLQRAKNFLNLVRPPLSANGPGSPVGERTDRLLTTLLDRIESLDVDTVLEQGLHEVLTWIVAATAEIGEAVSRDFFHPDAGELRASSS